MLYFSLVMLIFSPKCIYFLTINILSICRNLPVSLDLMALSELVMFSMSWSWIFVIDSKLVMIFPKISSSIFLLIMISTSLIEIIFSPVKSVEPPIYYVAHFFTQKLTLVVPKTFEIHFNLISSYLFLFPKDFL